MSFTKTSQKFGQWADSRANTVYGLGFSSESQLAKVSAQDEDTDSDNTVVSEITESPEVANIITISLIQYLLLFLVCRQVCRVQGGSTVSKGEVSGEDGAHQHSFSGNKHDHHHCILALKK